MKSATILVLCFVFASLSFGEVDAFNLRTKYGAPLDRETFTVRPGIAMVVDYGPGKQVCRIQLPSGRQIAGAVTPGAITKQQIDEVLEEAVPRALRGKELGGMISQTGAVSYSVTEYEHVTIGESKQGALGTGISVTFKDPACPKLHAP